MKPTVVGQDPVTGAAEHHLPLRIGVIGLGRAFTLMLPTFLLDARVKLVAAADPAAAARRQFESDFNGPTYDDARALCANPQVDVVYIASPHQFHAQHTQWAADHGKHVLVEKPMALSLDECTQMVDAAKRKGVHLVVGHSHSFNRPILRAKQIIDSGLYGAVKMIATFNYTDFLYRPRRPEELDTRAGGGVVYSQAAHQLDLVRLLGGGRVTSISAHTGKWDAARPTEGAYSALLGFENGAFATATYSGYAHFDSDECMGRIGEMGNPKHPTEYGQARRRLSGVASAQFEAELKAARNYGGSAYAAKPPAAMKTTTGGPAALAHQHFGPVVISCERADLKPDAHGVSIYADDQVSFEPLPPPAIPRVEVIDELWNAIVRGQAPLHSGEWARATTAVCVALLESAQSGQSVRPPFQIAASST